MAKTVVEEFVARLGWDVDASQLDKFTDQAEGVFKTFKRVAAVVTAAAAAITGLTIVTNRQTAVNTNLAHSLGMNIESLENWGFVLSAIGKDQNAILKSAKKLNVTLGQAFAGLGDANTIKDAVGALGLELKNLNELSPEKQFESILDAAARTENKQAGIAAAQQLIGRDAAELVGFLRLQDMTLAEMLEKQGRMNLMSDRARDGAVKFIAVWDDTLAVMDSAKARFSGLVGEFLEPILLLFTEWVALNKELIESEIDKWVSRFTRLLKFLGSIISFVWDKFTALVELLGGFNKALQLGAWLMGTLVSVQVLTALGSLVGLIKSAGVAQVFFNGAMKAGKIAMLGVKALGIGLFALIAEDIYQNFTGGESVTGKIADAFTPVFEGWMDGAFNWYSELTGIPVEQLMLEWVRAIEDPFQSITKIFDFTLQSVTDFYDKMVLVTALQLAGLKERFTGLKNHLLGIFAILIAKARNAWASITQPFKSVFGGGGGGTVSPSQSVVNSTNNNRGGNVSVTNENNISITQQPGQSGESLAQDVGKGIREETANAVKTNSSGVVY